MTQPILLPMLAIYVPLIAASVIAYLLLNRHHDSHEPRSRR
jgi:hypothetical protein